MTLSIRPRYITTLAEGGLLVAIPTNGRRALTKTFRPTGQGQGGEADTLARAVAWRDRAWFKLYQEPVPLRSFHTNARETSKTGVPGVRIIAKSIKKGERVYRVPYVIAEVSTIAGKDYEKPRGWISRLFSVKKYGEREAIALASAWRQEQLEKLKRVSETSLEATSDK